MVGGPLADLLALVGTEVVRHEVQPDLGRVERADVTAEGEELDAALALFDVAVEAVGADVVGRDQMPDAVRAIEGCADAFGLSLGSPTRVLSPARCSSGSRGSHERAGEARERAADGEGDHLQFAHADARVPNRVDVEPGGAQA